MTNPLGELRSLVTADGQINHARCRRLAVRATSDIPDLERAAALVQEITLLVPAIELAETLGGERQDQIDQILEILDEIEALSQPG
ncbi:hypothetical protein [Chelativorans salis]|uniref:Uncharacterized protein n=1 Tax=Chelativorans salis TaxID=2978478 RepID=A0ABT2LW50_9HYPH|nr:hypothetical protein [Chelativorans sp. EGI FJ00035]MCT7378329.1 hypothetical protein [Chelativorans sp. EGI FJ00035]